MAGNTARAAGSVKQARSGLAGDLLPLMSPWKHEPDEDRIADTLGTRRDLEVQKRTNEVIAACQEEGK